MHEGPPIYRKRCRRYDVPWEAHCLTFSCFRRLPLLGRDLSRQWCLEALTLARERGMYALWAYVIMPEHVHAVLLPAEGVRVHQVLTTIKQSVSKRALLWLRRHRPEFLPNLLDRQPNGIECQRFWQRGGGYDRNLRSAAEVHEKIRYIHENPVRRGLALRATDWPWSSAAAHETGRDEPIAIDRDSIPLLVT